MSVSTDNMLRRRYRTVSRDNESGEVLADKKILRISMDHPYRLVGQQQSSPGCCQDCCCKNGDSERTSQITMMQFQTSNASSEHQDYPEMSLNKRGSVEISPSFKKKVNISIFKEFLLGDQVFDEIIGEAELLKKLSSRRLGAGSFHRMLRSSKVVQFIKHRLPAKTIFITFLMILYTFFFIIPEFCPFAISILLLIKFIYYHYMHKKIHERADMSGIIPVFSGTIFGSGLIWIVRKHCTICRDKKHMDAVFKYYKCSSKEGIKTGCSILLLP